MILLILLENSTVEGACILQEYPTALPFARKSAPCDRFHTTGLIIYPIKIASQMIAQVAKKRKKEKIFHIHEFQILEIPKIHFNSFKPNTKLYIMYNI